MTKLDNLREALHIAEISHSDDAGITTSDLRGLLKVCDAYCDLMINYAMFDAGRFGVKITTEMLKNVTNRANEKLEEML